MERKKKYAIDLESLSMKREGGASTKSELDVSGQEI